MKLYKMLLPAIISFAICYKLPSQLNPSTPAEVETSLKKRIEARSTSLLQGLRAWCIGPNVQGGRITDLEVDPRKPGVYYAGFASGGLFRSDTYGQTWE